MGTLKEWRRLDRLRVYYKALKRSNLLNFVNGIEIVEERVKIALRLKYEVTEV